MKHHSLPSLAAVLLISAVSIGLWLSIVAVMLNLG
jgi:hypothetical protein